MCLCVLTGLIWFEVTVVVVIEQLPKNQIKTYFELWSSWKHPQALFHWNDTTQSCRETSDLVCLVESLFGLKPLKSQLLKTGLVRIVSTPSEKQITFLHPHISSFCIHVLVSYVTDHLPLTSLSGWSSSNVVGCVSSWKLYKCSKYIKLLSPLLNWSATEKMMEGQWAIFQGKTCFITD